MNLRVIRDNPIPTDRIRPDGIDFEAVLEHRIEDEYEPEPETEPILRAK